MPTRRPDRAAADRAGRPPDSPQATDTAEGASDRCRMPFYVSPEQLMRDRADFARKGIARGRSVRRRSQYADGILFVAENPSRALHKISEIYDRIALRRGRQVQRVREPAHGRGPLRRHARLLLRPPRRDRARAWPTPTRRRWARSSPSRPRSPTRSSSSSPRSATSREPTSSTGSPTTARSPTSTASVAMGGQAEHVGRCSRSVTTTGSVSPRRWRWPPRRSATTTASPET